MVRLGATYAPDGDASAALAAACAAAHQAARDVLIFAPAGDPAGDPTEDQTGESTRYRDLGFVPVLDRVLLGG
jgi:hypothetical protein